MQFVERSRESLGRLSRETGDTYGRLLDHAVSMQERNVRFASGVIEDTAREVRRQAEDNRALVEDLVGRMEEQRDGFRAFIEESVGAYLDLLYAPFVSYEEALRPAESEEEPATAGLPIEGYDELGVSDIAGRLDGLSVEELRALRDHEQQNKRRPSLLQRLERRITLAS